MPKREIIYPFFLECCHFAEDAFWESIFEDLAYGTTPYGTYISKNFLCCSYKGKEFSYKIERKEPKVLYDDIYGLMSTKVGILSQRDKHKKRLDFHQVEKDIKDSRQKWSDIRKKNIRDLLIERYVIKMRDKHSLSIKQAKYLLSAITLALVFKVITSKDITYDDGQITNIDGIEISNGKVSLTKDIYNSDITAVYTPEKSPGIQGLLSDKWEKFLKQLRKTV